MKRNSKNGRNTTNRTKTISASEPCLDGISKSQGALMDGIHDEAEGAQIAEIMFSTARRHSVTDYNRYV